MGGSERETAAMQQLHHPVLVLGYPSLARTAHRHPLHLLPYPCIPKMLHLLAQTHKQNKQARDRADRMEEMPAINHQGTAGSHRQAKQRARAESRALKKIEELRQALCAAVTRAGRCTLHKTEFVRTHHA